MMGFDRGKGYLVENFGGRQVSICSNFVKVILKTMQVTTASSNRRVHVLDRIFLNVYFHTSCDGTATLLRDGLSESFLCRCNTLLSLLYSTKKLRKLCLRGYGKRSKTFKDI